MHRIHLRGPWSGRRVARADGAPVVAADAQPFSIRLPCTWESALGDFTGRAVFSRKFNRPSGLDIGEQVWLVLEGFAQAPLVRLGEDTVSLISDQPNHWSGDITSHLRASNLLELEFCAAADLSGVVALEMRPG